MAFPVEKEREMEAEDLCRCFVVCGKAVEVSRSEGPKRAARARAAPDPRRPAHALTPP